MTSTLEKSRQAKKQKKQQIIPEVPPLLSEQFHGASDEGKSALWNNLFKASADFYIYDNDAFDDINGYLGDEPGDEFNPGQVSTVLKWMSEEIPKGASLNHPEPNDASPNHVLPSDPSSTPLPNTLKKRKVPTSAKSVKSAASEKSKPKQEPGQVSPVSDEIFLVELFGLDTKGAGYTETGHTVAVFNTLQKAIDYCNSQTMPEGFHVVRPLNTKDRILSVTEYQPLALLSVMYSPRNKMPHRGPFKKDIQEHKAQLTQMEARVKKLTDDLVHTDENRYTFQHKLDHVNALHSLNPY